MRPNDPWTIEQSDQGVVTIRADFAKSDDWSFFVLVRGDAHWDNPHSRRDYELADLEKARRLNAPIIDNGDLFCAMQGKYDKRSNKSSVRPEHANDRYLDSLVETAADFYEPYADLFVTLGEGNHETAITNRHETNLTKRLAKELRHRTGAMVPVQGYTGWGRVLFTRSKAYQKRFAWWRTHGYGGGGPVTKDTIQLARQRAFVQGADIMISSHTHSPWVVPDIVETMNQAGNIERRKLVGIKTGTYKDEHDKPCGGGWAKEKGHPPRPLGCSWLMFRRQGLAPQVYVMEDYR